MHDCSPPRRVDEMNFAISNQIEVFVPILQKLLEALVEVQEKSNFHFHLLFNQPMKAFSIGESTIVK
jgi:hypothetical protein